MQARSDDGEMGDPWFVIVGLQVCALSSSSMLLSLDHEHHILAMSLQKSPPPTKKQVFVDSGEPADHDSPPFGENTQHSYVSARLCVHA